MANKESAFQSKLIKTIKNIFTDCIVLKNDANYIQGIPDLLILYKDKWVALETKRSRTAKHRPNQDYYINKMNKMSFAKFIYPENFKDILKDMQAFFKKEKSNDIP